MFHLVRRFFGFLGASSLSPGEQARVRGLLDRHLARLFFTQAPQDQRHAIEVLDRVDSEEPAVIEAALLHDVGKTASGLGAIQRSVATVMGSLHMPLTKRWASYLDHGALGAQLLEDAGASELAVAFARVHPGPTPEGLDAHRWAALAAADET